MNNFNNEVNFIDFTNASSPEFQNPDNLVNPNNIIDGILSSNFAQR